jgi:DNA polymerase alpha subunit A
MSVYGRRCMGAKCKGTARFEYSDVELYNQLRYFAMLFDPDKAKKAATGSACFGTRSLFLFLLLGAHGMSLDEVCGLTVTNPEFLEAMSVTVHKYINQCGRRWVDFGTLFR